ncbi:putative dynein gamma chain, flagellar outer arm [Besnoitia besnoiti]|uniref:Putative dynein gamma chain, flagellar outer arm n=1 Tax=Besnoitia besnoiti TaxID=94643 RepID=A0A2A9MA05_BESBE|nr:putative dynein gamma chain, flagellar outer arm [Besnoitia besnoiti]PFH32513.1 putative dynein gamma chain, flagellar outer arm [Besnoitia besnoiti]
MLARSLAAFAATFSVCVFSHEGRSSPFFEVELQLDGKGVRLHPSLEEIQTAINKSALAVLGCSKEVAPWSLATPADDAAPQEEDARGETFRERISRDKEILKVLLLLTGSIQSTRDEVGNYLQRFDEFAWLWSDSRQESYEAFAARNPSLDEFERRLRAFGEVEAKIQAMESKAAIGVLLLNTGGLVAQLIELIRGWNLQFLHELHHQAKQKLESLAEQIRQMAKRLKRHVADIDALRHVMETLSYIREKEADIESEFDPVISMYNLLDRYSPSSVSLIDKEEQDQRLMLRTSWQRLLAEAQTRQDSLMEMQTHYKRELITNINSFKVDVKQFREDFERNGPTAFGVVPREAVERVRRFKEECEMRTRKQEIYFAGEDLFGFSHQSYPELEQTKREIAHLTLLYDLYVQVIDTMKEWKDILWVDAPSHIPLMSERIQFFSTCCKKLPKQLKDCDAYLEFKKEIDDFIEILPLLEELSKKSIMPRHWKQIEKITGKSFNVENEMLRLQTLTDAGLLQFKDDIIDICESADKQLIIEEKLTDIENTWKQTNFDFGTWKTRDYPCVLQGGRVVEIQEALEESQMALNTMNAMRHVAPFKDRVVSMLTTLSDVSDTIDGWTKVQVLWTSLEPVFTGGDIAKQMPAEAKRFHSIDKDWTTIMAKAADTVVVTECCQNELLKQLLPVLHSGLESCQKSLESYLEGKRNKFPRFYFVSNPVLLKILSQGSDAESVQEDFEKLFDAISRVVFDKDDRKKILKIKTVAGSAEEVVTLSTPLKVEGNIEDWLRGLESQMQRSVRRDCKYAAHETGLVYTQMSLRDFCDRYIAQVALLGIQMIWTADCQEALEKLSRERDRTIMNSTNKKLVAMMTDLVSACLSDLGTPLNRTKYETLVTIHVHQRDVFADLWKKVKEHRLKDSSDFDWLKQTRLYWKADSDNALIAIADVEFTYSYEYLGVKERLAITPLTDRCYLTCSQALGMFYGGAPAGPAGTGKTETVKDLGRTLGIFVVVTNCSDQHRYNDMAKIFKGLCQSGLWGCFDEFNRIDLEVLSVVAMQIESITTAKKQGVRAFMFPGEAAPIRLVPATAYFITMNPGYAGRQELPENLKVLFRSVSMMVPDRQIIIKVKLASVGYLDIDSLSKKFKVLYGLCEEQLSKQRHYDFGLRNILSVLRTAGATKRAEPEADEEMLLMRTLRDMNLSKLVADDVPLFLSLLRDIFPKQADPPKKLYREVESAVVATAAKNGLVLSDEFLIKVMQLYETSIVRHGFMLVGPTCSGKSEIASTLTTALTNIGIPTRSVVMNPKAITAQQMYGVKDALTEEWTPGVFAWMWAKYNNRALKFNTWITCDGPVDAIWIENLNTVLDDNKILTLANNDRIPMTENTRIVFEVENLNNASPATVSRAGIIYVSATDLGWKPLVLSWLNTRSKTIPNGSEEKAILTSLFEKYLFAPNTLEFALREVRHVMPVSAAILTVQILNLLSALLRPFDAANEVLAVEHYARLLTYALAWGMGGLLEPEDRAKFDRFLKTSCGVPDPCEGDATLFEYYVDSKTKAFVPWTAGDWTPPAGALTFASILVPTTDSRRAEHLISSLLSLPASRNPPSFQAALLVGGPGTAKTSTALMFLSKFQLSEKLWKRINLSSATTPERFQQTVEAELERKTGKTYSPPGGKPMTFFLDDLSMPFVNSWGDQITLELARQLIEQGGVYFLEKDKRGDFKAMVGLQYLGAMNHPGGGRNDIPNRLKSKFFSFNMILPSLTSVDNIYGAMLRARFTPKAASVKIADLSTRLTKATIDLWLDVKKTLLPTPSRFHYIFNMRDLSRVFQGILACSLEVLTSEARLVGLWKHECIRVFADKLARESDKAFVHETAHRVCATHFGEDLAKAVENTPWFVDFLRDGVEDESGEVLPAPKVYEPAPSLDAVRAKANFYLDNFNEENPSKQMNLVLFDAAVKHLMTISRIIQLPRGSAMLVGVGGSGKQSLARLAAHIAGHFTFQITLTKGYNDNALFDDLRGLYVSAGQKNQPTTFILTDLEIKSESFLEYMNSLLSTGEVAGLFAKDERDNMVAERRADFLKERPDQEETLVNLYNFFLDRVRDNLHVVLCFSPLSPKFAERAQKFPALFSTAIDWFLPWPEDALVAVSSRFLKDFEIDASPEKKKLLYFVMGRIHTDVGRMCEEYFLRMRRHVYVTPKSYLSFIGLYKQVYAEKFEEVNNLERSVNVGLLKLNQAAQDIKQMKVKLKDEEKRLRESEEQTNQLLVKVESESAKAQKKSKQVSDFRDECLANKERIEVEQEQANQDLQAALPYLQEAENAVKSITAKDIVELKTMKTPSDIIRLVFDGVMILLQNKLVEVRPEPKVINKKTVDFIHDSFDETAKAVMADVRFLSILFEFSKNEKDNINDETCELLLPYLELENFNPAVAKKASNAAEGRCKWVGAMVMYHEAAKIVKPKVDYLKIQTARVEVALRQLAEAEEELAQAQAILREINSQFEAAVRSKTELEQRAQATKRKMDQANKLINGLAGEKARWAEDSNTFADRRKKLVGDVTLAAAFVSYCGPFNSEYRVKLRTECFGATCKRQGVPASDDVNIVELLVDQGTIGEWNLQGLPADELSIQNGILVTRSTRYALMIDPQGQALNWIKKREEKRMEGTKQCITTLANTRLKDQLEFCLQEGRPLLIEGVADDVNPLLEPVLEKQILRKGKKLYVSLSDQLVEFNPEFTLYMTTKLANPHFSPELSAKCTVIDFTVTQEGLEQQLLGRVLSMEQRSLEESLNLLMEELTANTKALQALDSQLLARLSNSQSNLLDDTELIEVLGNTKAKAKEVEKKLKDAQEKKAEINEKREQYRPVATRGSVLYFCTVEMSVVCWMYNSSLVQFLEQFDLSIYRSEKTQPTHKRVEKIVDYLTYQVYRYVNRGLFERHKMSFLMMLTLKILLTSGDLTPADISLLLSAGAGLDEKAERPCPFKWLGQDSKPWLNILRLSRHGFGRDQIQFFCELPEVLSKNEAQWKKFLEDNEPEKLSVPDYEDRIKTQKPLGAFIRLCLLRALREDRTVVAAARCIEALLDPRYTEPVTDSMESIWQESQSRFPVLFLLSPGTDPTAVIDELAKKKKKFPTDKVSMGEGQEIVAREKIKNGFLSGGWVVLQNCHLGLNFMAEIEELLKVQDVAKDFRLWITCESHNRFPIGLLHMSIKVTNEPPIGLKAGLHRTFTTMVTQETLDKVDHEKWRNIVFATAFLHSVVQERRKFGALGWCVPYEFNYSDLEASLFVIEKHLASTVLVGQPLSWATLCYMVAEVQYGGRITDDLDRELFNTYTSKWFNDDLFKHNFSFNGNTASQHDFAYRIPDCLEISAFRDYINTLPAVDQPSVFGLHVNADLTFRLQESSYMLRTIQETQPKDSGSGGGKSREEAVKEKCQEILSKMPPDFVEEKYREQISKLSSPPGLLTKGLQVPLNIFLFQEVQRMQRIIALSRTNLTAVIDAIDGLIIMTPDLQDDVNFIFDMCVPKKWLRDPSGAEISWISPTLGKWFSGMQQRVEQLVSWLQNGRPKSFWLSGFFNPEGFLTGVMQEVTRQHKKDQWGLDDVVLHTEVKGYDYDKVKEIPDEGVNIHGLYIEGSRWNWHEGKLDESLPKVMIDRMPILYVTAVTSKDKKTRTADFGQFEPYDCPVYKYPRRTDNYLVFRVNLRTEVQPSHWKLRGTALLCSTE